MWKHKNFINLQLCAGPQPFPIEVNGTMVLIERLSDSGTTGEETWSYNASINTDKYTISGNTVVWNDGTILQYNAVDVIPTENIIWNRQYTTRSATPTLTFKHFYDVGTIGSGAVKFRHYSQQEPTPSEYTDCLTFTGETSEFTLKATNKEWDGTLYYSTDHNTWNVWDGTAISSANKKLYLRGKGNTKFWTSKGARLSLSAKADCSGNIQTLLDWESPPTSISTMNCYSYMFSGCTNLTAVPNLPAITLAQNCYSYMFYNCTNLTTAPPLPATTLAKYCYSCMFYGCTKLKLSKTQTTEYKTPWRIPSSGTISSAAVNWNASMFDNTGGTFAGTPSINTTYYGAW